MRKILVTAALLSIITLPAAAADMDMPAKAPWRAPEAIISDWSGFYVGVGAGYGWGREKFDNPADSLGNLFGTPPVTVFGSDPVLVQPGFAVPNDLSKSFKQRDFVAGGFFGAQKQFGNWVLGIEADIYATGMKGSFSGESTRFNDIRGFLPETIISIPGQNAPLSASADVKEQEIKIEGQSVQSTGNLVVAPQGLVLTETITGLKADSTLHKGAVIPITLVDGNGLSIVIPVLLTQDVKVDSTGKAVITSGVGGNVVVGDKTFTTTILTSEGKYQITVNGATVDKTVIVPGQIAAVSGTAAVAPIDVPVKGVPHEVAVNNARIDRSLSMSTKIEELGSVRGKVGLAASPNWMIYGTGGLGWAHMTRTMTLTQTISAPGFDTRSNSISASTGDTRLGYVVGAGIDWKLSPNVVLGALYLHYEFPKSTVAFADSGNSVGFGTSRQSADVITGRLSWMVPIH